MRPITRQPDETLAQYHHDLYTYKDELGLSNLQIADLLNSEYGTNYDESKFRKEYQAYKNIWQPMIEQQKLKQLPEEYNRELFNMQQKYQGFKKMYQDQKREFNKQADYSARFQHIQDEISQTVQSLEFNPNFLVDLENAENDKELVILVSDWHIGTKVTSSKNPVQGDILESRVKHYLEETLKEINLHKHKLVTIANLGDLISGIIHVSSRVSAEEDVIQQLFKATELLSNFIANVATIVPNVKFVSINGNHGRCVPQKDAALQEENFEKMILWYIQARLSNFDNIEYFQDEDGMVELEVLGDKIIYVHGDNDRQASAPEKLSQMLGYVPNWICLGHTHHDYSKSHGTTTVIVNPSLIGGDGYSISGRFGIGAAQKLVTFEKTKFGVIHTVKTIKLN